MAGPRQTSADKAATPAVEIDGARVLVVEARFYDKYADELLAGALAVLEEAGCRVDVVTVPGALEIPSAIVIGLRAADEAVDPYEAVVALGTVIRGETGHYDIVAGESSRALMDLSVAFALPLGNGILTVETVSPPMSGQPAASAMRARPAAKSASQTSVQPRGRASVRTKPSGFAPLAARSEMLTASAFQPIASGGSSGKKWTPATSASAVTTTS